MAEHKWYNAEQKQRWIESIQLEQYPMNYWDVAFTHSYPYEEELGKDLYNFNKVEIKNMYMKFIFLFLC